jgi:hypothetical protein
MLAMTLLSLALGQAGPPALGMDPDSRSARLLLEPAERPASAAWMWGGAIGGGLAGGAIGLNVALQVSNALPSQTQSSLNPSLFAGSIAVGLIGGAVSGYLTGKAAREGWLPGKVAVWTVWGLLSTAASVAAMVLFISLITPKPEPLTAGRSPG